MLCLARKYLNIFLRKLEGQALLDNYISFQKNRTWVQKNQENRSIQPFKATTICNSGICYNTSIMADSPFMRMSRQSCGEIFSYMTKVQWMAKSKSLSSQSSPFIFPLLVCLILRQHTKMFDPCADLNFAGHSALPRLVICIVYILHGSQWAPASLASCSTRTYNCCWFMLHNFLCLTILLYSFICAWRFSGLEFRNTSATTEFYIYYCEECDLKYAVLQNWWQQ